MASARTAGLLLLTCFAAACGQTEPKGSIEERRAERQRALTERLKDVCAANATGDRLKQVAFDEAIRIRNADPQNLDILSTHALVRIENPVVVSRDETLDVTVCKGRLVLHIPPGAERAFDGKRTLSADIEYAAQAAADGSGLVYQLKGAEPIIYRLAAFDLKAETYRPAAPPARVAAAEPPTSTPSATARPVPPPTRTATATPKPIPARTAQPGPAVQSSAPAPARRTASPSFNCRYAKARSEQMVCGSERLAALDRTMSSQFYSALSRADERTRAELRQSRDRFLAYRNRCADEDCVAEAYRDRMDEIRDIAG